MLRDTQIRNAKAKAKEYYLADGDSLRICIHPNGSKYWRIRYRFDGKPKTYQVGQYPGLTIREARAERDRVHTLVEQGIRPAGARRVRTPIATTGPSEGSEATFRVVAEEWIHIQTWNSAQYASATVGRLRNHVYPHIGNLPITEVTTAHLLGLLKLLEDRLEQRNKVKEQTASILFYAVAHGYIQTNPGIIPSAAIKAKPKAKHRKPLPWKDLERFLRDIDHWSGNTGNSLSQSSGRSGLHPVTRFLIKLQILTLARPGEMRKAVWSEFNLKERMWTIPAKRMKADREHKVPLSDQAMQLLAELREITGHCKHLFPGVVKKGTDLDDSRTASEGTALQAIKRMGYDCHPHGFRRMASTYLHSLEDDDERPMFDTMWIEFALAHRDSNKIREAYNASRYLKARKRMLQFYADQVMPRFGFLRHLKAER